MIAILLIVIIAIILIVIIALIVVRDLNYRLPVNVTVGPLMGAATSVCLPAGIKKFMFQMLLQ